MIFGYTKKVEIAEFKYFQFYYSTGNAINSNVRYTIRLDDGYYATIKLDGISEENAVVVPVDDDIINDILNVLKKYDVNKWNGFDKADDRVLDGNNFNLNIIMKNNNRLLAAGYMKWPNNYNKVKKELDVIFNNLNKDKE